MCMRAVRRAQTWAQLQVAHLAVREARRKALPFGAQMPKKKRPHYPRIIMEQVVQTALSFPAERRTKLTLQKYPGLRDNSLRNWIKKLAPRMEADVGAAALLMGIGG